MSSLNNNQELEGAMLAVLSGVNEQIAKGQQALKQFMLNPACVEAFLQQISQGQDGCRHLAAVLLRACISKHWAKLPAPAQQSTKVLLLDRLVNEPKRGPRLGIAALISKLAKHTVPSGEWNELMQMLNKCSASAEPGHREVAMMLFRALAENITSSLRPHFGALKDLFVRGMEDQDHRVRLEAIRALGVLVVHLVSGLNDRALVEQMRPLIPILVTVTQQCVAAGDDESAAAGFEVFSDLAECTVPILNEFIPALVELMVKTLLTDTMEMTIREKAGLFMSDLVMAKPAKIVKFRLVQPVIQAAVQLFCEPHEECFVAGEMTPQRLAMELLDATVLNVPVALTFDLCMQRANQLLQDQANPHSLKAGFLILATVAEAHSEGLAPHLAQLVQAVHGGTQSPNPLVRAAACTALTQFAENMQPGIAQYHEQVLPRLMDMLSNPREENQVKRRACFAIECFCEYLGDEIKPYLGDIMQRLLQALQSGGDKEIQLSVIHALTAVAATAGEAFMPYFQPCMQMMGAIMERQDDELLDLRAKATECIGAMGNAVGSEAFAPYLQHVMQLSHKGMELDYPGVRESNYRLYSHMARMMSKGFAPYLMQVMPYIIASTQSMEGIEVSGRANDALQQGQAMGAFTGGTDSEEEDEELEERSIRLRIRSGALDEKIEAITCMGAIFNCVGEPALPWIEKCLPALVESVDFPHEYVRAAMVDTLGEIVNLCARCYPRAKWQQSQAVPLSQETLPVMQMILPCLKLCMFMEDDKRTAAIAVDALTDALRCFGFGFLEYTDEQTGKPYLHDVYEGLIMFLNETAPCQRFADGEVDDKTAADHDEVLIDNVTDLIGVLAQTMGAAFEPAFKLMWEPLMKFNQPHRPVSDRSMAMGCVAEVGAELGASFHKYIPQMFPEVLKGLADEAVPVRRNSAFCAGVMFESSGASGAAVPFLEASLNALQRLFDAGDGSDAALVGCKDNAVSAVAKMIMATPDKLPLAQVVPLLLSGCPLLSDFSECKYVYRCILGLFNSAPQLMMPHVEQVVSIFAKVVNDERVEEEVKGGVKGFCTQLLQQKPDETKAVLAKLPVELANGFLTACAP